MIIDLNKLIKLLFVSFWICYLINWYYQTQVGYFQCENDVDSLIILIIFNHVIVLVAFVVCLCDSLKYVGNVITSFDIVLSINDFVVSFILINIIDVISSYVNLFVSPLYCISMISYDYEFSSFNNIIIFIFWIILIIVFWIMK